MSSLGSDSNRTALQLSCPVERVSRNFDEKRLKGAVFLYVAKAFDTVFVDSLLYKINFPSYLVKTISSYLNSRTSKRPFKQPHSLVVAFGVA